MKYLLTESNSSTRLRPQEHRDHRPLRVYDFARYRDASATARVRRDAALQAATVSGDSQFEAVHNRASIGRVIAIPVGLVAFGLAVLYDVFGWLLLGLVVLFALTLITPAVLKRSPMPSRLASSALTEAIVDGLVFLVLWFVLRGVLHPHFIGWGSFLRLIFLSS
jgi:hypothetical protein